MVKVDWEVSHYTGVTDSDGSVIYTGDFVKGEVEGLLGMQEVQGVVYYEMGNCILDCGNVIVTLASLVEFDEELYVLGNKFENPDMLDN